MINILVFTQNNCSACDKVAFNLKGFKTIPGTRYTEVFLDMKASAEERKSASDLFSRYSVLSTPTVIAEDQAANFFRRYELGPISTYSAHEEIQQELNRQAQEQIDAEALRKQNTPPVTPPVTPPKEDSKTKGLIIAGVVILVILFLKRRK